MEQDADLISKMKAAGAKIYVPSEAELNSFKSLAGPVYDRFKADIGAKLVSEVEAAVKAAM